MKLASSLWFRSALFTLLTITSIAAQAAASAAPAAGASGAGASAAMSSASFASSGSTATGSQAGAASRSTGFQAAQPGQPAGAQFFAPAGSSSAKQAGQQPGQQSNQQAGQKQTTPSAAEESPSQTAEKAKSTADGEQQKNAAAKAGAAAPELSAIEKTYSDAMVGTQKSGPQSFAPAPLSQFGYSFFRPEAFTSQVDVPVGEDYVVGPGDSIVLTIWGSFEGIYNLEVNRSGEVLLPQFGPIKVAGARFGQLNDIFRTNLDRLYKDFKLSVNIGKLRQIKVYLVGEVRSPGDYNVSSMATLINALAAAGGPTRNGSLREIQIKRNGQLVTTVDLYDFFLNGDKSRDIRLQSGDTVLVPSIGAVAGIAGTVRRPGIYEMKGSLSLKALLDLSGGLLPTTYLQRIQIVRLQAHEKVVVMDRDLDPRDSGKTLDEMLAGVSVSDQDLVKIFPIDRTQRGYVRVNGYVLRPGDYALTPEMKVADLLKQDNLLPEFDTEYAQIVRIMPPDYHPEVIIFNPKAALAGDPKQNLKLQEFDEIRIYNRWELEDMPMVSISGEVNKPGTFRLMDNMTVRDLLVLAQNTRITAYLKTAELKRHDFSKVNVTPYSVYVDLEEAIKGNPQHNLKLQKYDELVVKQWFATEEPQVTVSGEVRAPGTYRYVDKMTVRDLLVEAGSPKRTAYLKNAEIKRYDFTKTPITSSTIYINVEEALKGDPKDNVKLEKFDELVVKKWVAQEEYQVYINGEVRAPGSFRYVEGMTLRDLVIDAGNLKFTAYLKDVEIDRRKIQGSTVSSYPINVSLEAAMGKDPQSNIALQPFDTIVVRKIPEWTDETERYISLRGEFVFPGTYPVFKGERLSSVIRRAGGFTPKAYLHGGKFMRSSVREQQQKRMDEFLAFTEAKVNRKLSDAAAVASSADELAAAKAGLEGLKSQIAALKQAKAEGRVVLRLDRPENFTGSAYDLEVMGGDVLDVPQRSNAVTVLGRVTNPSNFIAVDGREVKDYLRLAGGVIKDSEEDEIYVIRADGTVDSRQQYSSLGGMFGQGFMSLPVESGDAIVVPQRLEHTAWMRNIKDVTTILSQIAISAGTALLGLR